MNPEGRVQDAKELESRMVENIWAEQIFYVVHYVDCNFVTVFFFLPVI